MRTVTRAAPEEGHASVWHDAREGLRFVFARPWLWAGMAAATISLLCTWGPWEVLVPYLVKNELGGSAGALGLVFAAGGAGAVLAAVTMGQRRPAASADHDALPGVGGPAFATSASASRAPSGTRCS